MDGLAGAEVNIPNVYPHMITQAISRFPNGFAPNFPKKRSVFKTFRLYCCMWVLSLTTVGRPCRSSCMWAFFPAFEIQIIEKYFPPRVYAVLELRVLSTLRFPKQNPCNMVVTLSKITLLVLALPFSLSALSLSNGVSLSMSPHQSFPLHQLKPYSPLPSPPFA